jgi:hypothetical protein
MVDCPSPEDLRRYLDHGPTDASATAVGEHLNRCAACQKRLDNEVFPELAASLRAAQVWPPGLGETAPVTSEPGRPGETTIGDVPDQIGVYKVVARLGGGGQGELFRVNDPMLARELALKLGRKPFDPTAPAERDDLVREARTLAALKHDGLVNVHALGFLDDGRPYLVLDLVLGANLEEHVGSGRLEPRRAAEIVERLARVVEYLHAHGILHLDIKPRNVMIDVQGQPRLIDLGLARLRYAWAPAPDLPWGGTPTYLAPEQARGELDRVGRATDVFGLGGVLFFLLTGRALYDGANFDEIIAQARRGPRGGASGGWGASATASDLQASAGPGSGEPVLLGRRPGRRLAAISGGRIEAGPVEEDPPMGEPRWLGRCGVPDPGRRLGPGPAASGPDCPSGRGWCPGRGSVGRNTSTSGWEGTG